MLYIFLLLGLVITYVIVDHLLRRLLVGGYRDKYVLVTGCDSGFGQRLVIRLDKLGFKVFAGCLADDGKHILSQNCSENVVSFLLDVRNNASIQSALNLVRQYLPPNTGLWGLVNNAGILGNIAFSEFCTKNDYLACMEVNLFGLIEMTKTFLPLVRNSKGRVINTSSCFGRFAVMAPVYTITKFGVEAYSDIVRKEMYSRGVKVILLEPGGFKTQMINVDKIIDGIQTTLDNAPEELSSQFKGFLKKFPTVIHRIRLSDNLDLVVDAYIHGLTSLFPRTRYAVGWDSKYLFIPLSYLPTWLVDWLLHYRIDSQ